MSAYRPEYKRRYECDDCKIYRAEKSYPVGYLFKIICRRFTRTSSGDKSAVTLNTLAYIVGVKLYLIIKVREKQYKQTALTIKLQGREFHEAKHTGKFPSEVDSLDYLIISERMESYRVQLRQLKDDDEMRRVQIQEEMKQYLLTLPDSYGKAYALSIDASRYCMVGNWKGAIEYGIEALRIYDMYNVITDKYIWALCSVAQAYNELDNPAKAYGYMLRAYELRDDYLSSDCIYYDGIIGDLAMLCEKIGNYKDAIKYGIMYVDIKEPAIYSKNAYGYFLSLNNLATYYGAIGQYHAELEILQYLIKRAEEIDPWVLEYVENPFIFNLAWCYIRNGDYNRAIETGLRVKRTREGDGKTKESNVDYLLASAYRLNGNLEEALYYANQANVIQKEIGGNDNLSLSDLAASLIFF